MIDSPKLENIDATKRHLMSPSLIEGLTSNNDLVCFFCLLVPGWDQHYSAGPGHSCTFDYVDTAVALLI